jgi:hypothetical protein
MGYIALFPGGSTPPPGVDINNSVRISASGSTIYQAAPGQTDIYGNEITQYVDINSVATYTFFVESYTFSNGSPGSDIDLYDPVYEWFIIRGTSSIYTTGGIANIVATGSAIGPTSSGVKRNLDYLLLENSIATGFTMDQFEIDYGSVPHAVYSLTDWNPNTPAPTSPGGINDSHIDPEKRFYRVSVNKTGGTSLLINDAYVSGVLPYPTIPTHSYTKTNWVEGTIIEEYWNQNGGWRYRLPNNPVVTTNTSTNPSYITDADLQLLYKTPLVYSGNFIVNVSVSLIPYETTPLLLSRPQLPTSAMVTFTYSGFQNGDRVGVYLRGSEKGDFLTFVDTTNYSGSSAKWLSREYISSFYSGVKWNYVSLSSSGNLLGPPFPANFFYNPLIGYDIYGSAIFDVLSFRNRFLNSPTGITYYDKKDPNPDIGTQDYSRPGYTYVNLSPGVSHSTPTGLQPTWIYETPNLFALDTDPSGGSGAQIQVINNGYGITISGASASTYGDLISVLNEKISNFDWSTSYAGGAPPYQPGAYFSLENGQFKITSASQSENSWAVISYQGSLTTPNPNGSDTLWLFNNNNNLPPPFTVVPGAELFSSLNNFSSHHPTGIFGSAAQPSINNIKKSAISNLISLSVTLAVPFSCSIQALPDPIALIGTTMVFSVETALNEGTYPGYQWQRSQDGGTTWLTVSTSPTYQITTTLAWDQNQVRLLLTSSYPYEIPGGPVAPTLPYDIVNFPNTTISSLPVTLGIFTQAPNGIWLSGSYNNSKLNWLGSQSMISVNQIVPQSKLPYVVSQLLTSYRYKTDKTYLYLTNTKYDTGLNTASFSIVTEWNDSFTFSSLYPSTAPGLTSGCLAFYSNPNAVKDSRNLLIYRANSNFIGPTHGIINARVYELDFNIQGYSYFIQSYTYSPTQVSSIGWSYFYENNEFIWKMNTTDTLYPIGGNNANKISDANYKTNNNISRFIEIETFNLYFTYEKISGGVDDGIDIYLSLNEPSKSATPFSLPIGSTKIASLTQSISISSDKFFLGLEGNKYLFFVATASSSAAIRLSNIKIEGYYHPDNNRQYLTNLSDISPIGIVAAAYSANVGVGNADDAFSQYYTEVFSKIGNASFKAGIWENGFWNNGWRYDNNVYEFYNLGNFYDYNRGKNWRFIINGASSSVSNFKVGDKVSIGNVVAIDINEERKLIKSYFTITEIPISKNYIVVELISNFPLVRIQIDSIYHRIYVTKNIWLYGVFLNGYFKGVWNSGLFKGYPRITEMYDSHWIDGIFDGGHFYGRKISKKFIGTQRKSTTLGSKLSLVFGYPILGIGGKHGLNVGDLIVIEKDDELSNTQYNRECVVVTIIDDYSIITDIQYGIDLPNAETGTIYTSISTGLIQNFDFNSGNVSKITSVDSMNNNSVFNYNSWIDVVYDQSSAVNIGKPQTILDPVSNKIKTENNLYGWPTNDVLSSSSKFRDSFSLNTREYKLGNKYKIHNDFIGESSKFEEYFNPTNINNSLFLAQGWTYSISSGSSLVFERTVDTGVNPFIGEELSVVVSGPTGGVLNLQIPQNIISDRYNYDIEKLRYSIVEFDLLSFTSSGAPVALRSPMIHFNNVNEVTRLSGGLPVVLDSTFLPIYENIEHVYTQYTKKYEYFYNKRNLSMYFRGNGSNINRFIIDNLKFYEIDMIPFFKYFLENNINISLQVPYTGISPFIDYTNTNFSYIDNISIGRENIT